MGDGMVNKKL